MGHAYNFILNKTLLAFTLKLNEKYEQLCITTVN